ncbi:MAG: asparagine synthetase B [Woeseiaceae bacterium]|nr:asparagine synthetase B [Woeseiaceae bacterium]
MGAVFGVVGDGDLTAVREMGRRMAHRGSNSYAWNPCPGVYLGENRSVSNSIGASDNLALDERIYRLDSSNDADISLRNVFARIFNTGNLAELDRIRGPFSAAYWNDRTRQLVLAVDQLGLKSLYYCQLQGRVAFASEYKAFFALPDFRPQIDPTAIQYHQATRTAMPSRPSLQNVKMLRSGSIVSIKDGKANVEQYWQPEVNETNKSIEEWSGLVKKQTIDTLAEQIHSHKRVGISLSGGIDSAIVAASACLFKTSNDVTAYSVGLAESDPEIVGARQVADHLGIDHKVTIFESGDIKKYLPEAVWLSEDCTAREEALLTLKLYQFVAGSETLLLNGYGADSIFGGMPRHKIIAWAQRWPLFRHSLLELYQLTQTGRIPTSGLGKALGQIVYRGSNYAPPRVAGASGPTVVTNPHDLNQHLADSASVRSSWLYIEPMAEQSDLDVRSPFDHMDGIDLALSIPVQHKVGLRKQKIVLRKAFADLLPDAVMKRPKTIQRLQHDLMLSSALDEMVSETANFSHIRERRLVDSDYLERVRGRKARSAYPTDQLYRIWTLISLEIWLRQFADGGGKFWTFDS